MSRPRRSEAAVGHIGDMPTIPFGPRRFLPGSFAKCRPTMHQIEHIRNGNGKQIRGLA